MRYIKRVAPSNHRVTYDRHYEVSVAGYIRDDRGRPMRPCLQPKKGKTSYWVHANVPGVSDMLTEKLSASSERRIQEQLFHLGNMPGTKTGHFNSTKNEESKMLKIKKVTIVNGQESTDMSENQMLNLIERETKAIERLQALNLNSKFITKMIDKHTNNLDQLASILPDVGEDE